MNIEVITKEDLQQLRLQLIEDIQRIFTSETKATEQQRWLKGTEVRKLLKISSNTLQQLRVTGRLHPSKVGGIFYYSKEEIEGLFS